MLFLFLYFVVVSTIVKHQTNKNTLTMIEKMFRALNLMYENSNKNIIIVRVRVISFICFVLFRWLVVIVLPLNATCGRNISNNERLEPNCGRWFSSLFIRCIQFRSDKPILTQHNIQYTQWKSDQSHSVRHSVFFFF